MTKPRIQPQKDEFLYATDVAFSMGVCVRTVTRLIRAGKLPGYQIGTSYRIPVPAWESYKRGEWQPLPERPAPMPAPEMLRKRKAS
jgi:excisionase family DNA binding protein